MNHNDMAAYILAGGQSNRFEGQPKGMQLLNGKPLISHCINRLKPQIDCLHINSHLPIYGQFNLPLVTDSPEQLYQGPLFGLSASMRHFCDTFSYSDKKWMLLTPCDSPFIPLDLVEILESKLSELQENDQQTKAVCVSYQNQLQPTFSIWHRDLSQKIEHAIKIKQWGGLKIFLKSLGELVSVIEYPEQKLDPFFNINTSAELKQAELQLKSTAMTKHDLP